MFKEIRVMTLTSHIEAGFERKLKTGTIFIDLTAAYETVWRDGLMLKFINIQTSQQVYVTFKYFLVTNLAGDASIMVYLRAAF
jgi:hypothetical protein